METEKEFKRERVLSSVFSESVGEYSLPDYNTDIKKILLTEARAVPSGKFLNGESLEFSGIVGYEMVYLDGENNITHLSFTTDYDVALKVNSEAYIDSDADIRVANFGIRLMGPRKIMAKATLESDVHISESDKIEILGDTFTEGTPEVSAKTVMVRSARFARSDEREYAEEIMHIDGAIADEVEVLLTLAEAEDVSLSVADGGVTVRGNINVSALVKNGDEVPTVLKKSIPYSERIDTDEEFDEDASTTKIYITSCVATVTPDEEGVSVVVSLITECSVRMSNNEPLSLLDDCYLKDRGTENEYSEFRYSELLGTKRTSDNYSWELSREAAGCENARNFTCTSAEIKNETATMTADGVKIECEVRFNAIACEVSEDGTVGYSAIKFDVPYVKNVNIDLHMPDARVETSTAVTSANIEIDSENVYPSCTLNTFISVVGDKRSPRLAASSVTDETYVSTSSKVTVYFPESADTLFGVAKKFHTSPIEIAQTNSLVESCVSAPSSPSSLAGVRKLIIK